MVVTGANFKEEVIELLRFEVKSGGGICIFFCEENTPVNCFLDLAVGFFSWVEVAFCIEDTPLILSK